MMQRKARWFTGIGLAGALLVAATVATGASAQSAPPRGSPVTGSCPGFGVMGGFGPGLATSTAADGAVHDAVADSLGITAQELWDARAAGKTVAQLAAEKNVPLEKVVDAAVAAHTAELDAAVKAGSLSQTQADALTQLMRSHIQAQFQVATGVRGLGPGMMGGRGMMGGFGFGSGRGPRGAP